MVDKWFSHLVDDTDGLCTQCGSGLRMTGLHLDLKGARWEAECPTCDAMYMRPSRND